MRSYLADPLNKLATGSGDWPLLIIGPVGTGKTYFAVQVLDTFGGVYHTASDFCQKLIVADERGIPWPGNHITNRQTEEAGVWRSEHLWQQIKYHPLVVIDELGVRGETTHTQRERIQTVLDYREGRPLILISNLDVKTLGAVYDDRIMSRITRGTVITIKDEDRRQK